MKHRNSCSRLSIQNFCSSQTFFDSSPNWFSQDFIILSTQKYYPIYIDRLKEKRFPGVFRCFFIHQLFKSVFRNVYNGVKNCSTWNLNVRHYQHLSDVFLCCKNVKWQANLWYSTPWFKKREQRQGSAVL